MFATPRAIVLLPAAHPLTARRRLAPASLAGERLIVLAPQDTARIALDYLLLAAGAEPRIVVETPFSATVAALAEAGVGIGLVNPLSLREALSRGLVVRPFEPSIHFRALLLRAPGAGRSRLLDAFVAALHAARSREGGHRPGRKMDGL